MHEIGTGIVTSINHNILSVRMLPEKECISCGNSSCSAATENLILAENKCEASEGNLVRIMHPSNIYLQLNMIQFVIPVICFITGVYGADTLLHKNLLLPREIELFLSGILTMILGSAATVRIIKLFPGKKSHFIAEKTVQ